MGPDAVARRKSATDAAIAARAKEIAAEYGSLNAEQIAGLREVFAGVTVPAVSPVDRSASEGRAS